jgi:hypothetical protein
MEEEEFRGMRNFHGVYFLLKQTTLVPDPEVSEST